MMQSVFHWPHCSFCSSIDITVEFAPQSYTIPEGNTIFNVTVRATGFPDPMIFGTPNNITILLNTNDGSATSKKTCNFPEHLI